MHGSTEKMRMRNRILHMIGCHMIGGLARPAFFQVTVQLSETLMHEKFRAFLSGKTYVDRV